MKKNLKYYLKKVLTKKELGIAPTSFDVVGSIMIFAEFPKELVRKERKIGRIILDNYNNIKTVLRKTKKYSGKYRIPKYKIMAGDRKKEGLHKENNGVFLLDVEKVYFSSRLATERKRINQLVKKNESVLVMFSGCGVYPINIAKNSKVKEVYGVEINPTAHKYAVFNVKKNKVEGRVKLFKGDVRKIVPGLKKKFDRIVMPLPRGGENYLELALRFVKKKGFVHFYDFLRVDDFELAVEKVKYACDKAKKECKILEMNKCGEFGPRIFRICVNFKVLS